VFDNLWSGLMPIIPHAGSASGKSAPSLASLCRAHPRILLATLIALATLLTLWLQPDPYVNLGERDQMAKSGLFAYWDEGDIVVLVRHAERCDRSSNPCLGDPSGITVSGSEAADGVGNAFKAFGLSSVDIFASPRLRTVQTAYSMFDLSIATEDWLANCRNTLAQNIFEHKKADRNLLLVTHSGCIEAVARTLNTSGAEHDSEYTSALFVFVDKAGGRSRLLGYMSAEDLKQFAGKTQG
jgi:phosphohistidine phosphatase SixA